MISLVLDASGHRVPAVHPYGFIEHGPHRAAHVTHIVSPNLSGRVRQALWVLVTRGVQQDPRCFNGVAGDTNNASSLLIMIALLVGVQDLGIHRGIVALDFQYVTFGWHLAC